jgi:hypothetical protein
MKNIFLAFLLSLFGNAIFCQQVIPLYSGKAPGSENGIGMKEKLKLI